MTTLLLLTVLAAPPAGAGECDWTFSRKAAQQTQPAAKSTFAPATTPAMLPPLIAEGRIQPAGIVATVGASSCGNPLCPCGPQCDCRNCCCGLTREAIQQRARQTGVAESVTLPPITTQPSPVAVYQPRYVAPPPAVYYPAPVQRQYAAPSYYATPFAAPAAGNCPGGVCPLPGG